MNTQTHILLAVSVMGNTDFLNTCQHRIGSISKPSRRAIQKIVISGLIFGALLPDLSLFIMFGYAQFLGLPHDVIWGEMYYSPFWQFLGAISNSIPVYLLAAIIAWWGLGKMNSANCTERVHQTNAKTQTDTKNSLTIFLLMVCTTSLASLTHAITDLPLHHDDGHPHFWPVTNWIYSSPVSYWDDRHYANYWAPIEIVMGLIFIVILWRRYSAFWAKVLLLLAALGYVIPYYLFSS